MDLKHNVNRYVTISERVFRDLVSQKSKVEDIKALLCDRDHKSMRKLKEQIAEIVYSTRYTERGENDGRSKVD